MHTFVRIVPRRSVRYDAVVLRAEATLGFLLLACGGEIIFPRDAGNDASVTTSDALDEPLASDARCGSGVNTVSGSSQGCVIDWDYGCPIYEVHCDCGGCKCSHDGMTVVVGVPSACRPAFCVPQGTCDGNVCLLKLIAEACGFPTQ